MRSDPGGARRQSASGRTRLIRSAIFLVVAFLIAVAAGLVLLVPAASRLLEAREEMEAGKAALLEGDPQGAGSHFTAAEEAFDRAADSMDNPLARLAAAVPVLGRTPDTVDAVAEAGGMVARAGQVLTSALGDLPGGVASLAPLHGTVPLERMARLAEPMRRAAGLAAAAEERFGSSTTAWVPDPLAGPAQAFQREVSSLHRTLDAAHALMRRLPAFLGAAGPRRYFVGAQNPAELRGTGGLIGAYAILTVEDGKLSLGPFRNNTTLENVDPASIQPPSEEYARLYDRYGGAGFWQNINMTPDFPTAAEAIERLYERTTGVHLDGAILADPEALALLVEATGPVGVPGTDTVLEADQVVPFLANEAYRVFEDPAARKQVLGAMAGEVLRRYLSGGASQDPAQAADALVDAAAEGHLLLHATDREVQDAFELAGVAGGLAPAEGDQLAVVANNAGGNKVDFFVRRTATYRVTLLPEGSAAGDIEVRYRNGAPRSGQPAYVIGPYPGASKAGEDVVIASTYCGRCEVHSAARNGSSTSVSLGEEAGHTVVTNVLRVPAGRSASLAYGWTVDGAWTGDANAGTYRLTYQGQPTIRPTGLEVTVVAPPGTRIVEADPSMVVDGDRATWRGAAGDEVSLEVRFARPLGIRILRAAIPFAF